MSNSLALYTTVYRGAEEFLSAWYQSLSEQTDKEFDLWIGTDQISQAEVFEAVEKDFQANWVTPESSTPAGVRQDGINAILDSKNRYEGIVFVDCDDVMYPGRIQSGRAQLRDNDVAGCAMDIVNEDGSAQHSVFGLRANVDVPQFLARMNVFGMSNTVYRTDMLRQIPAVNPNCRLMDWFLATAAWIRGARFAFDNTPRMQYRQYSRNVARVIPPFTPADIDHGTTLMIDHYRFVLSDIPDIPKTIRSDLEFALANTLLFRNKVVDIPLSGRQYVNRLNDLPATYLWWEWIALSSLEDLWKNSILPDEW